MSPGPDLRARALALLARREHGRAELGRRLAPHAAPEDDVEALLDDLERAGLLSEARFAEQWARRRAGRHGVLRLTRDLEARGVRPEHIETVVNEAREGELDRAITLLRRKYPEPPADAEERGRQGRFLQNRGFSPEVIHRALRAPGSSG